MEFLLLAVVLAALIFWLSVRRKSDSPAAQTFASSKPNVTLTIETVTSRTSARPDTGQLTPTSGGVWVLNPKSPLPVTISKVDKDTALVLKERLEEAYSIGQYDTARSTMAIIARSNLRWAELDDYVSKYGPQYLAKIDELKRSSQEWPAASEKDREDLLTTFRQHAIEVLEVRPYCDLEVLFEGEPSDLTIDDALIDRYGFESLQLYLRYAGNISKVRMVPADNPQRTGFEELVTLGLARRGTDIPLPAILETLRLQDLNDLAASPGSKPFGRKARAVEFLMNLPDINERVGRVVAFRELFQLNPLPSEFSAVDLKQVSAGWRYAAEIAELLTHTYVMGAFSARNHAQYQEDMNFIRGWEVLPASDACPFCKRAGAKTYSKNQRPRVPLHIGCRCTITSAVTD